VQGALPGVLNTNAVTGINQLLGKNLYRDVMSFKKVQSGQFFKDTHGNTVNKYQKPIGLYHRLLQMFAFPNSIILDATCGTGSLELAAMEINTVENLSFVAFEKNAFQSRNCVDRLQRSCTKPTSLDDLMIDEMGETYGNGKMKVE
jgi:hypothetical protein